MDKSNRKIVSSAIVLVFALGIVCLSLAAPGLAATQKKNGHLPQKCAEGMDCSESSYICPFGSASLRAAGPGRPWPILDHFPQNGTLFIATGFSSSAFREISSTYLWSRSPDRIVFANKVPIHILNSVLTL